MTITNPFTLAPVTTAPQPEEATAAVAPTPYDALCTDASRPQAFTMTFLEPAA